MLFTPSASEGTAAVSVMDPVIIDVNNNSQQLVSASTNIDILQYMDQGQYFDASFGSNKV